MSELNTIQTNISTIVADINDNQYNWGEALAMVSTMSDFMVDYDLSDLQSVAANISSYASDLTSVANVLSTLSLKVVDNTVDLANELIQAIYNDLSTINNTLSSIAAPTTIAVSLSNLSSIITDISEIDSGVNDLFRTNGTTGSDAGVPVVLITGNPNDNAVMGGLARQQLALWYYINGHNAAQKDFGGVNYYVTNVKNDKGALIYATRTALDNFNQTDGDNVDISYPNFSVLSSNMNTLATDVSNCFGNGKNTLSNLLGQLRISTSLSFWNPAVSGGTIA